MDLPAPDGPVSATRWPASSVSDDVVHGGALAGVGEGDVTQFDLAPGARAVVGAVLEDVLLGQHLGDAVGAGQRGGELGRLAGEAAHRARRLAGVADEDDQLAGGHRALGDAQDADDGDDRRGQRAQDADRAVEAGLQARDLDAHAHPLLAAATRTRSDSIPSAPKAFTTVIAESASLAMLARSPSWRRCLRARSRTFLLKTTLTATSSGAVSEREQREERVDPQQHDRHAEREQRGLEHLAERVAEQLAHVVDVLGHRA